MRCFIFVLSIFTMLPNNFSWSSDKVACNNNEIIAKVNSSIITKLDISKRSKLIAHVFQIDITNKNNIQRLNNKALDTLIDGIILKEELEKANIEVSADAALTMLAKQNNMQPQDFLKFLEKSKIDIDDFKDYIKNELFLAELVKLKIKPKVFVTDKEILENKALIEIVRKKLAMEHRDQFSFTNISMVELAEINLPSDISQKQLEDMMNLISTNNNFEKAASKSVTDGGLGGVMGWVKIKDISSKYLNNIYKLRPGEIGEPMLIDDRIVILKVLGFKNTDLPNDDIKIPDNEIYQYARNIMLNSKLPKLIDQYFEDARQLYLIQISSKN